jgi:hypothetical protein
VQGGDEQQQLDRAIAASLADGAGEQEQEQEQERACSPTGEQQLGSLCVGRFEGKGVSTSRGMPIRKPTLEQCTIPTAVPDDAT